MRLNRLVVVTACSLGMLLAPGVSSAQSDQDRAAARSLATQGADSFKAGKFAEAVDMFSRAEKLVHAPPHLLYIARSQAKLGKLVLAQEAYQKVIREQLAPDAPAAFGAAQQDAQKELAVLEPRIGSLRIAIEGESEGAAVTMDGGEVPGALIGVFRPVDPGKHKVTATPKGGKPVEVNVELAEGEKKEVTLKLAKATAPPPVDTAIPPTKEPEKTPVEPPPAVEEEGGFTGMQIGGFVGIGLGVAGAAVGTIFLIQQGGTQGDADDAFAKCNPNCSTAEQDTITGLDSDAAGQGTIGVIGLAAGGGLLLGGLALVLFGGDSSSAPSDSGQLHVTPWVSPNGGGLQGTF